MSLISIIFAPLTSGLQKHRVYRNIGSTILASGSSNFGSNSPQSGLQPGVYDEASSKVPGRVGNNHEYNSSEPARDAFQTSKSIGPMARVPVGAAGSLPQI